MSKKYQRGNIGEQHELIGGSIATIIDGGSRLGYCTISYNNGESEKDVSIFNLRKGKIKNEYTPKIYNIGYIGSGEYVSVKDCKGTKNYKTWKNMLRRCYSKDSQEKDSSYIGVTVCDEWHNFQNFAKWYEENYREFEDSKTELDKDLLSGDNKIYSPETCVFIPAELNLFLSNKYSNNTTGFIGVRHPSYDNNKFVAQIKDVRNHRQIYLGVFNSAEEASKVYNIARAEQCEIMKQMCINKWNITDKRILDNIK